MAYRIEPASITYIPWLRMLFMRWTTENAADYPTLDDEEYDNFVLALSRRLSDPDFACFVAIIGRRVIGFLAGAIDHRPIGKPHRIGNAHWLYVVPKHRKKGVASMLIAHGLAWLSSKEVDIIELSENFVDHEQWARRGLRPTFVQYRATVKEVMATMPTQKSNGLDREATHGPG